MGENEDESYNYIKNSVKIGKKFGKNWQKNLKQKLKRIFLKKQCFEKKNMKKLKKLQNKSFWLKTKVWEKCTENRQIK